LLIITLLDKERGPKPDAMNINYRPVEDFRFDLENVKDYPFYAADDPTNVRIEKDSNQIKAGTLPKIIERLTHHKHCGTYNMLYRIYTNTKQMALRFRRS
jgi:hypothetical protein